MSRLFYDDSDATSSALPRMEVRVRGGSQNGSRYLEKIAKLIPSEIIAGYIGLVGLVPLVQHAGSRPWIYLLIFALCLVLTPVYLVTQANRKKPYRIHILLSTLAFVIWSYSVSGATIIPQLYDPAIASMLLIVFTLVSGAIPLKR